jgi:hypothetical protein
MVENISTGAPHRQLVSTCEPKQEKSVNTAFLVVITHIFCEIICVLSCLATITKGIICGFVLVFSYQSKGHALALKPIVTQYGSRDGSRYINRLTIVCTVYTKQVVYMHWWNGAALISS